MRRIAIGLAVGVAAWVGSALRAEAQVIITPTGPLAITTGSTSTTAAYTVTNILGFFRMTLTVSLNGVPQQTTSLGVSHTGTSANVSFPIDFTQWTPPYTATLGDVIEFDSKVTVFYIIKATNSFSVPVTNPTSRREGSNPKTLQAHESELANFEAADRDRREWA